MNIEDKILALVKMANPEDPVAYTQNIVKSYAIEKINNGIRTCTQCELHNNGVNTIGYGDINSSILVIADDISEEQFNQGTSVSLPLFGEDGEIFDRALGVIQANKEALYIINSVNCYSAKMNNGSLVKKIPSVKERTACKSHVDKVIQAINPAVIITLGSVATNSLSSTKISIMESRGQEFDYRGYPVIPTFHPGFFRQMASRIDEEMMNMYKDNFLYDLYVAFSIAITKDPNCKIGDITLPF